MKNYIAGEIARARATRETHPDPETRARAQSRVERFAQVWRNIMSGAVDYGTNAPVKNLPKWATLDVVTGGFATGAAKAEGKLLPHESELIVALVESPETVAKLSAGAVRFRLNTFFASEIGQSLLLDWLESGRFSIGIPEEGALLVAAWLAENGRANEADALIETLRPYFSRLRFYPIPTPSPRIEGDALFVQNAGETIDSLREMTPHAGILRQRESVEIWAGHHDHVMALAFETVANWVPFSVFPGDWRERAKWLLNEFAWLETKYVAPTRYTKAGSHYAQLRDFVRRVVDNSGLLTEKDRARAEHIMTCYEVKRGRPGSEAQSWFRQKQRRDVAGLLFCEIAKIVAERLADLPRDLGITDPKAFLGPLTTDEVASAGEQLPQSVRRRVLRARAGSVETLIDEGLVPSGDVLAALAPQLTGNVRAECLAEPALRPLDCAIYRAFRKRRSLLLLDLAGQVKLSDLPWVAPLDALRVGDDTVSARRTLTRLATLQISSFPHAIVPNKMRRELAALAHLAKIDAPLVDELATDIFQGTFTAKFQSAAKQAIENLGESVYTRYFGIDVADVLGLPGNEAQSFEAKAFASLCRKRAGESQSRARSTVANGRVIEEQQILTTQNLAACWFAFGAGESPSDRAGELATRCLSFVLGELRKPWPDPHTRLIRVRNAAYAWRQMCFFLSVAPLAQVETFFVDARVHFGGEPDALLGEGWQGLLLATWQVVPREMRFLAYSNSEPFLEKQ